MTPNDSNVVFILLQNGVVLRFDAIHATDCVTAPGILALWKRGTGVVSKIVLRNIAGWWTGDTAPEMDPLLMWWKVAKKTKRAN